MSYIYLQEQEGEYLEVNCLDIPQSVLSKLKNTQGTSYCSDSETESCQNFQYGTTSALSTVNPGEDQLTFWQEDSHAKTLVQQVKEQELPEHVRDYGKSMRELLTKYGLALSLPKTHHCFALGELELSSKIWPRWGMMLDGACWELGTSVRHIKETECGSWLTPKASDTGKGEKSRDILKENGRQVKPLRSKFTCTSQNATYVADTNDNGQASTEKPGRHCTKKQHKQDQAAADQQTCGIVCIQSR